MAHLARIAVYPLKSCDAHVIESATTLPGGALANDRRWALVDRGGDAINGKRFPAVHRLRTTFDLAGPRILVHDPSRDAEQSFHLEHERAAVERWFSDYFDQPATIIENTDGGFPDDLEMPGPTVISTATLTTVAEWFGGLTLDEARARFRANLEIDGVEPFWEDRLLDAAQRGVPFRIGDWELLGLNPCARCAVPSRDPFSGKVTPQFARTFAAQRRATLPPWAPLERFDHFYRLAVNTRAVDSQPRKIHVGDAVEILASR